MPRRTASVTPFTLIAAAWAYCRKQPVLVALALWFLALPGAVADMVEWMGGGWNRSSYLCIQVIVNLLVVFLSLWAMGGILLVGRRMIQNKAGRARSSIRAVMADAAVLIVPLLVICLLRLCLITLGTLLFIVPALLVLLTPGLCGPAAPEGLLPLPPPLLGSCWWSLLLLSPLLLPAFIYFIRTTFAPIALVADDLQARQALRHSSHLVRGHTLKVSLFVAILALCLLVPAQIAAFFLLTVDHYAFPVASLVRNAFLALGSLFFTLSLIAYYGELRRTK
jgi:hypothetical protein